MVSDDCIYLTCENYQIWLDYGVQGELRNFYLYKNGLLKFTSNFCFMKQCLCVSNTINNPIMWKCEKNNNNSEYSIIIDNYVYCIDKNNLKQVELFKELVEHIFG